MSLRYALLGMLCQEPASGYDLTKYFEKNIGRYAWHAKHTQIYPELNRLADEGLIRVAEKGARGRRTYGITAAGRAELRAWLVHPSSKFGVRNEYILRLFLVSALEGDDARELLRIQIERSVRELEQLRAIVEEIDRGAPKAARLGFGRVAAEYGLRHYQTMQDWAKWALGRIHDGEPRAHAKAR